MRLRGRGGVAALALCLGIAGAGCRNNLWWEYRDDPYMANIAKKGEHEVLRNVNHANRDQRMMALRIVANQAGQARREGRVDAAKELEEIILRRYFIEKDQAVRACVVQICAPAVGKSSAMVRFLRDRIASGEFPGYAALSLAALGPQSAYDDIQPLTRHPAPDVKLQAAVALTVLGDMRGYDSVVRVWKGMEKSIWPERIEGVSLKEARRSLEARAERAFGKSLR